MKQQRHAIRKYGGVVSRFVVVVALLGVACVCWALAVGAGSWFVTGTEKLVSLLKELALCLRPWLGLDAETTSPVLKFVIFLWDNLLEVAGSGFENVLTIGCPAAAVIALMRKWIDGWSGFWGSIWTALTSSAEFVGTGEKAVETWRAMRKSALCLAGPFVLMGVVDPVIDPEPVLHPPPRVELGMVAEYRTFGKTCRADGLTLVQAKVHALKKDPLGEFRQEHGVVCGYVRPDSEGNEELRATAAIHYGFETNNPISTLSMLVEEGEFWKIDYCRDETMSEYPLSRAPEVRSYRIDVDVKHVSAAESAPAEDTEAAGSG